MNMEPVGNDACRKQAKVEGSTDQQPRTVRVDGIWPAFHLDATVSVTGTVVAAVDTPAELSVVSSSASESFWQIPWITLALVLLLIALLLWWVLGRKRRKKAAAAKVDEAVRAALAERGLDPAGRTTAPTVESFERPISDDQR